MHRRRVVHVLGGDSTGWLRSKTGWHEFVADYAMIFGRRLRTALVPFDKRRTRSLLDMKYFAPFLLILSILPASAIPRNAKFISPGKTFDGAGRTITWRPWQQNAKDEFRFRRGDRYLGRAVWEHYLGFEQNRTSSKAITVNDSSRK